MQVQIEEWGGEAGPGCPLLGSGGKGGAGQFKQKTGILFTSLGSHLRAHGGGSGGSGQKDHRGSAPAVQGLSV